MTYFLPDAVKHPVYHCVGFLPLCDVRQIKDDDGDNDIQAKAKSKRSIDVKPLYIFFELSKMG